MPSIPLHISPTTTEISGKLSTSPLPTLLQTPSGLGILEIQGTIHAPVPSHESNDIDNGPHTDEPNMTQTQIGRLEFPLFDPGDVTADRDDKWMKKVYLYIGKHQRLTGEVKKLPKPLGIIRRIEAPHGYDEALELVEVVKYKVLFAGRPEPVGGE